MDNLAINYSRTLSVLLLFIAQFIINPGSHAVELTSIEPSSIGKLQPMGPVEYRVVEGYSSTDDARRRLAPFQLCLLCKCCATSGGGGVDPSTSTCSTMPCCFGIDCQLPNKPFGVCAFVPNSCNCTSCGA